MADVFTDYLRLKCWLLLLDKFTEKLFFSFYETGSGFSSVADLNFLADNFKSVVNTAQIMRRTTG